MLSVFAEILQWILLLHPHLLSARSKPFSKTPKSLGSQKSAAWLASTPCTPEQTDPVTCGFPTGIFWNEQLFSSSSAFFPLTPNRADFSLLTECCQSSPKMRWTWQAAAQLTSPKSCLLALSHCFHARVWLRAELSNFQATGQKWWQK